MSRPFAPRRPRDPFPSDVDDLGVAPPTASLSDWLGYARGSIRRRPWLTVLVFVAGLSATTAYYALARPMYEAETKVLAQRPIAVSSAIRQAAGGEPPTRTAEELIRRRDNLVDIVKQAGLLEGVGSDPDAGKSVFTWIRERLGLPVSAPDPLGAMVTRLGKALVVTPTEETIRISVKWRDPMQAYHIVEGALQNYLEARQAQEITALDEGIALLQARLATFRAQLEREEARRDDTRREDLAPVDPLVGARVPIHASSNPELARLKSLIEAKERAIRDMEDFRRRRLLELQAQLDERRNVYAEAHPVVIGLRKEIEGLSSESSQIGVLREQERSLRDQYASLMAQESRQRGDGRTASPRPTVSSRGPSATQEERVKDVRSQFTQVQDRVNAAQLELDAARAAFKHRYQIVWPAEVPREPVSPNPWKIFPAGIVASILLALILAVLPDAWSRRIFERWQLERSLGLEVLTDFRADKDRR